MRIVVIASQLGLRHYLDSDWCLATVRRHLDGDRSLRFSSPERLEGGESSASERDAPRGGQCSGRGRGPLLHRNGGHPDRCHCCHGAGRSSLARKQIDAQSTTTELRGGNQQLPSASKQRHFPTTTSNPRLRA